jgi:hypothetical protein
MYLLTAMPASLQNQTTHDWFWKDLWSHCQSYWNLWLIDTFEITEHTRFHFKCQTTERCSRCQSFENMNKFRIAQWYEIWLDQVFDNKSLHIIYTQLFEFRPTHSQLLPNNLPAQHTIPHRSLHTQWVLVALLLQQFLSPLQGWFSEFTWHSNIIVCKCDGGGSDVVAQCGWLW